MKHTLSTFGAILFTGLMFFTVSSCKKYADPPPYFEEDSSANSIVQRKVLLVVVDGLVSSELQAIDPVTIKSLLEKGKYSYKTKSEPVTTDAATWKSILSGVSYGKHKVRDSAFTIEPPSANDVHAETPKSYPSVFSRILTTQRAHLSSYVVSPWKNLTIKMAGELLDKSMNVANDAVVKDSVVSLLSKKNPDLLVANFNSVNMAGVSGSFSATNAGYKNAVIKVDEYIGQIMTALKARPNYNKTEEWLVIISSNHGGIGNAYGGNSAKETDVFTLYYNENLKKQELVTGGYNSVTFSGKDAATIKAEMPNGDGRFNMGDNEQTIELKYKQNSSTSGYPHFFSKMKTFVGDGWSFFTNSDGAWCVSIRPPGGSERRIQGRATGITVNDLKWHTLTFIVYDTLVGTVTERWAKRFTDGVRIDDPIGVRQLRVGNRYQPVTNAEPIRIGWGADANSNPLFTVADIKIFNKALSDAEVRANLCLQNVTAHPKYANLLGYWPCDDGYGIGFVNKGPQNSTYNFNLTGNYVWGGVNLNPCVMPAPTASSVAFLPKVVDIAPQIFYWLKIPVKDEWTFGGKGWLVQFDSEFIK
jgi:hypothetical protein